MLVVSAQEKAGASGGPRADAREQQKGRAAGAQGEAETKSAGGSGWQTIPGSTKGADRWITTDRGGKGAVCRARRMVPGTPRPEPFCGATRQTDNSPALQACKHARKVTPRHGPVQLCVDSQLVTDRATLWLPGCIRRRWKAKGSPVSNKDLWQDLRALLLERQAPTEWIKVPLHVGPHGNEMADQPWGCWAWYTPERGVNI